MSNGTSPRIYGLLVVFIGLFLTGLNHYCALRTGEFFAVASIAGPTAAGFGVSTLIRPPAKWPPTEFKPMHKIFTSVGFALGVLYFLSLKFGGLGKLFHT